MRIGDRRCKPLRSTVSSSLVLLAFFGFLVPSEGMQIDISSGRWLLHAPWYHCTRERGAAVMAGGLVLPAVARGVSSSVPSAFALGIGPHAPLAGGTAGAINGSHPLPREGVAEWVDPPQHSAPLAADQSSQAARKKRWAQVVCPIFCISSSTLRRVSTNRGVYNP